MASYHASTDRVPDVEEQLVAAKSERDASNGVVETREKELAVAKVQVWLVFLSVREVAGRRYH